jgi:hypothetical protein
LTKLTVLCFLDNFIDERTTPQNPIVVFLPLTSSTHGNNM